MLKIISLLTVLTFVTSVVLSQEDNASHDSDILGEKCGLTSCEVGTHCCISDKRFCCQIGRVCKKQPWGMACLRKYNDIRGVPAMRSNLYKPHRHG
uniref:Cysteine rich secreted protein n=1 Tax=Riptortus pedestris TaxID=329032 RepID=R4WCN4_RIPPE|nr:cysteine rich secreted protein [Riptortus pedestris]